MADLLKHITDLFKNNRDKCQQCCDGQKRCGEKNLSVGRKRSSSLAGPHMAADGEAETHCFIENTLQGKTAKIYYCLIYYSVDRVCVIQI